MTKWIAVSLLALLLAPALAAAEAPAPKSAGGKSSRPAPKDPVEKAAVAWEVEDKVALARATEEKKPVLIFVYIGGG